MCIYEMRYGQFNNLDFGFVEHVNWDKIYVVITHVIINIVNAYITCGTKPSFDESQHVINLSQGDILIDSTCVFTL